MSAYQQRVVNEKQELDEKLNKLRSFIKTDVCMALPFEDRSLLAQQERVMTEYSRILAERIARFSLEPVAPSAGL